MGNNSVSQDFYQTTQLNIIIEDYKILIVEKKNK